MISPLFTGFFLSAGKIILSVLQICIVFSLEMEPLFKLLSLYIAPSQLSWDTNIVLWQPGTTDWVDVMEETE